MKRSAECEACPSKVEIQLSSSRVWHASCKNAVDFKRRYKRLPEYIDPAKKAKK